MKREKYKYEYTLNGETLSLTQWAKRSGLARNTILSRLNILGMDFEEAITRPVKKYYPADLEKGTKVCCKCLKEKELVLFSIRRDRNREEYYSYCKECNRKRGKENTKKLREEIIFNYSNGEMKCCLCPENRVEVLDLDHINGSGLSADERRKLGHKIYYDLRAQGFPKDNLRILCRNCNWVEYLKRAGKTKQN